MVKWENYREKLEYLKKCFEEKECLSADVEVRLLLPGDEGFQLDRNVPYLLVRYYLDGDNYRERKIELFEYYLDKDIKELMSFLTALVKEFIAEVEQTEYGGG
ncbi:hypothetical protein Thal_1540 [Thermocrinis albus DSM 14484]|uniref:Dephospho-CoA kinase n=1 Tax=Thermocrinis albus (strain DSM 14484 / JCM 11386 / HI 11/12) TaxID=638303 RepID=D3SN39_THEAH|nr:hypothetical protein [Thermocrinis albus]ADC90169.1 hypothetical protein Thal_1540 [Thermocrinis albus DSM 14484]